MWYFYVSNVDSAPAKITRDYGRLGALVAVGGSRGQELPGCTWVELDPALIPDAKWDESTQTLIDGGARFEVSWKTFWQRLTDAEQDALFDLAQSSAAAYRLVERIRMNLADGEGVLLSLNSTKADQMLTFLVNQGVITSARRTEIVGT
jgi:hypothetical protein